MSTILASARPKHAFKIAFDQLKPYRFRLLGVLVLGLVTAICGLIGPWAVGVVVDKLLITPDFRQVLGYCLIIRSEEHTSELQSRGHLVCSLLPEKKKDSQ